MDIDTKAIQQDIIKIKKYLPQLNIAADMAISAIKASENRSQSQEKNLSAAAKYTVAVSAMRFVTAVFKEVKIDQKTALTLSEIIKKITGLKTNPSKYHNAVKRPDIPSDWSGKEKGPWLLENYKQYSLSVIYSKNLPDGNWTVCIMGIPCIYGADANQTIEDTKNLIDIIVSAKKDVVIKNRGPFFSPFTKSKATNKE